MKFLKYFLLLTLFLSNQVYSSSRNIYSNNILTVPYFFPLGQFNQLIAQGQLPQEWQQMAVVNGDVATIAVQLSAEQWMLMHHQWHQLQQQAWAVQNEGLPLQGANIPNEEEIDAILDALPELAENMGFDQAWVDGVLQMPHDQQANLIIQLVGNH